MAIPEYRQTYAMIKASLGDKILKLRKKSGLSQEKLALQSGIGYRYLQDLEYGNKQPTVEVVFKLSKTLGVTPGMMLDDIFGEWRKNPQQED